MDPFPLTWPAGWPRTPSGSRGRPNFDERLAPARDGLLRELRLLRTSGVVITSNLPTRRDGMLYANGALRGDDPGIAVYWKQVVDGRTADRVMACDRWRSAGGNLRALALSIGAIRGLDRWGGSTIVDRAFASFNALPPAGFEWRAMFPGCHTLDEVKLAYRRAASEAHPDHNGGAGDVQMARLNEAYAAAKLELAAN